MTAAVGKAMVAEPEEAGPPSDGRTFRWIFVLATGLFLALVFLSMAAVFAQGLLFGGDWGQYVLTSQLYFNHQPNTLYYPEPVLPLLYVPVTLLWGSSSTSVGYAADIAGGLLLLGIYLVAYRLFSELTGSRWAGLTGALLVATSPLLMDEVGWAGQAQFLAILLGLLGFWVLFRKVVVERKERWSIVVGALLALSALSESYSALYFLVALAAWFLLAHRERVVSRAVLPRILACFLPAVLAVAALAFANASLAGNVLGQPIVARVAYLPMYKALYLRFAFDSWVLLVLYPSILVAYLCLALLGRLRYAQGAYRWFVPALAIAWVPQFLFFTPVVYTDRALYFAVVPAGAMVALLARALPTVWRRAIDRPGARVWRTRWGRVARDRHGYAPLLVAVAVLTVGAQAGVAAHSFYHSLTYYSYDAQVLEELEQMQSKNGSMLLLTPNLGNFASAWASGRNTLFGAPIQPATFTRTDQQAATVNGNLLSYGPSWISVGDTWAIDAEPAWSSPAPLLLQYSGQYLFPTLEMNDSLGWVAYSPSSDPSLVENVSLFSAPSIVHRSNATSLITLYAWPGLLVTKTISTNAAADVTIGFRFAPSGTIVRGAGFAFSLPNPRHTLETTYSAAIPSSLKLTQVYKNGFLPYPFSDTVDLSASGFTGTTVYTPANATADGTVVSVLAASASPPGGTSATYTIAPDGMSSLPATVIGESTVLSANQVSWVAVEQSMGTPFLERFLNDPQFSLFATTPHYLFFETNWA